MKFASLLAASATICLMTGSIAFALPQQPVMTLDLAKTLIAGCQAKAEKEGWKMNIAVVDAGANLVAFERMDGAYLGSRDIALRKAEAAAKFPFPTRALQERVYGKDLKGGPVPGLAFAPGVITVPGGLPVKTASGVQIGAIGVSGATSDQDEVCAQAGLDAAKDALK
jgi:glc operon protein GlcG